MWYISFLRGLFVSWHSLRPPIPNKDLTKFALSLRSVPSRRFGCQWLKVLWHVWQEVGHVCQLLSVVASCCQLLFVVDSCQLFEVFCAVSQFFKSVSSVHQIHSTWWTNGFAGAFASKMQPKKTWTEHNRPLLTFCVSWSVLHVVVWRVHSCECGCC
jgi:hypothetical protein